MTKKGIIVRGAFATFCIVIGVALYTWGSILQGKNLFEGVIIGFILGIGATMGNYVLRDLKKR